MMYRLSINLKHRFYVKSVVFVFIFVWLDALKSNDVGSIHMTVNFGGFVSRDMDQTPSHSFTRAGTSSERDNYDKY